MPLTNFPNGISSFGVPVIGAGPIVSTGNFWFVNSAGPSGDGTSTTSTLSTVAAAMSAATASNGDVIFVMPGHTEAVSSATSHTWSKAGVTVLGLGSGANRPTFTHGTAATATINITAANITIQNCLFVANFADVAGCFTLTTAKNFTQINNEFRDTTSILNYLAIVDTNTTSNDADGITLTDCNWFGLSATANTCVVKMDGTNTRLSITGTKQGSSYYAHAALTAAGVMPIAAGKLVTNARIVGNVFNLVGATNLATGLLITTNGTTNSGILASNFIQGLDATTEILVTASSGFIFSQNFYSGAADTSGYLLPAADA